MTAIEAAPAPARRLAWQRASVRDIVVETPRVKSLMLHVPGWRGHRAGQHVDIRLTGEDGYQAQRSYSIASPPEDALLALTVEGVENGEVSPYLVDKLRTGDQFGRNARAWGEVNSEAGQRRRRCAVRCDAGRPSHQFWRGTA